MVCVCVRPSAAAPGDRYEVRVKYFHPMHFDTATGRYVLELPTVVPKVGGCSCWLCFSLPVMMPDYSGQATLGLPRGGLVQLQEVGAAAGGFSACRS